MNINHILRQVASLHGVSVEAVYRDLQEAIQIGMNSKDPKVQTRWSRISKKGSEVTPEQLLEYLLQTLLSPPTTIIDLISPHYIPNLRQIPIYRAVELSQVDSGQWTVDSYPYG